MPPSEVAPKDKSSKKKSKKHSKAGKEKRKSHKKKDKHRHRSKTPHEDGDTKVPSSPRVAHAEPHPGKVHLSQSDDEDFTTNLLKMLSDVATPYSGPEDNAPDERKSRTPTVPLSPRVAPAVPPPPS